MGRAAAVLPVSGPLTAPAETSRAGAAELSGVVIAAQGPHPIPGRRDPWKTLALLLLAVALAPVLVALAIAGLALRLGLAFLGLGALFGRAGGRSFLDEILLFHVLGAMGRPAEAVPVYHYIVDTGARHVPARQEGEFVDGRILVGNRVRLRGRWRSGTLLVTSGRNETYGARLSRASNAWPVAVLALALLLAGECSVLANHAQPLRPTLHRLGIGQTTSQTGGRP